MTDEQATYDRSGQEDQPRSEPSLRVMLADDHTMLREALRRSVESAGSSVIGEAGDGEEAVRLALDLHPDVVLMDVSMPILNGVEAARQIHERDPAIPVVILTMHADADVVRQAFAAGAVGYVVKDASMSEVLAALRLAASRETVLSADVAASMLIEAHRLTAVPPDTSCPAPAGSEPLITKREEEVLQLVAEGLSTPEVAARLYISIKTVKNHLASIYAKLDSRDRTQAVIRALKMGIVKLN